MEIFKSVANTSAAASVLKKLRTTPNKRGESKDELNTSQETADDIEFDRW